ncbi:response regulator transcription factor [Ensifer sp. NM-2]|uniref:winged helix-turn-helix transcriptional regulator n=1 Tax=Ensifer sp. NM-2 TaxID=2109730 RepID=UPI0013048E1E|nr:response regulator transcription factor [Ensifer sp. NM-2]
MNQQILAVIVECPAGEGELRLDQFSGLPVPVIALIEGDDRKFHLDLIRAGVAERFHRPLAPRRLIEYLQRLLPDRAPLEQDKRGATILRFAEIRVDVATHRVFCAEQEVHLPPLEFKLLVLLMRQQGQVCSRVQLIEAAWPPGVFVEPRTVDVHVGRLRRSLRQRLNRDPIRTVRSIGYALSQR